MNGNKDDLHRVGWMTFDVTWPRH